MENAYKNQTPKTGKSLFKRMDRFPMLDQVFEQGIPLKFLPKLVFIIFLIILYIGYSHQVERTFREITKLEREIEDLRVDYTTLKADYMYASKQSEVARRVSPLGLIESTKPPHKIMIKTPK